MVEAQKVGNFGRTHSAQNRSDSASQLRNTENEEHHAHRKNSDGVPLLSRRLAPQLKIENPKRLQSADKLESHPAKNLQSNFRSFGVYLDTKDTTRKKPEEHDEFEKEWEVMNTLGKGCHGICYLMKNKKDLKYYACKIVKTRDPEIIKNEKNAFNILKDLSHKGIVQVKDLQINETKGIIRLVMKLAQGMTLARFIQKQATGRIEGFLNKKKIRELIDFFPLEPVAAKIFKNIAESINYLHKKGICHRDIKPENILVDPVSFQTVLIDFGIAKYFKKKSVREFNKVSEVTQEMWTPTGTHFYKAPEMLEGDSATEKVDVWALGVTLYEMVAGRRPFESSRSDVMIERMLSQNFDLSEKLWGNFHPTLKMLIKRLLNPDPKKRMSAYEASNDNWVLYWDVKYVGQTKKQPKESKVSKSQLKKSECSNQPNVFQSLLTQAEKKLN